MSTNELIEHTKIKHAHYEWMCKHLFTGPRWLTLPIGYKFKEKESPIEVTYRLSWSGSSSTVWAETEVIDLGPEIEACGSNGQEAHDNLFDIMNTSGFNRKYLPFESNRS